MEKRIKIPGLVVRSIRMSFLILIILFVVTTIVCLQASKRTAVHFNDLISPWLQNRYSSDKDNKKKTDESKQTFSGNAYRFSQSVSIIAIFVQTVANKRDFSHSNKKSGCFICVIILLHYYQLLYMLANRLLKP